MCGITWDYIVQYCLGSIASQRLAFPFLPPFNIQQHFYPVSTARSAACETWACDTVIAKQW